MKKVIFVLIATILILTGCQTGPTVPEELTIDNLDSIKYAQMIPEPKNYFSGFVNVTDGDGGEALILFIEEFTEEEYLSYIEAIETSDNWVTEYKFEDAYGAYSTDKKFWVEIMRDSPEDLYIFVQIAFDYLNELKGEETTEK